MAVVRRPRSCCRRNTEMTSEQLAKAWKTGKLPLRLDDHFATHCAAATDLDKSGRLGQSGEAPKSFFTPARTSAMPHPFAPPVVLDPEVRERLQALTQAHSTPQALVFRCRLILRLAAPNRPSNLQVANEFGCSRTTVTLWRTRYLQHGLAGLQDAPRSGRPRSFSPR